MIFVKPERAHVILPHTGGRYSKRQFGKMEMPIIERFVTCLMYKAKNQGKKCLTMNIMIRALEIIELLNGNFIYKFELRFLNYFSEFFEIQILLITILVLMSCRSCLLLLRQATLNNFKYSFSFSLYLISKISFKMSVFVIN